MGLAYAAKRLKFRRRHPTFARLQDARGDADALFAAVEASLAAVDDPQVLVTARVSLVFVVHYLPGLEESLEDAGMGSEEVHRCLAVGYLCGRRVLGLANPDRATADVEQATELRDLFFECQAAEQIVEHGGLGTALAARGAHFATGTTDNNDRRFILGLIVVFVGQSLAALEAELASAA